MPTTWGKQSNLKSDALRVPFFGRIKALAHTNRPVSTRLISVFLILAWMCLILAGMRPFRYEDTIPVPQEARNIMLAIDFSTSMARKDFDLLGQPVSRIDVVKSVVRDFITKRVGDRLGLVVFGSAAYTLAPLSLDMQTLGDLFEDVGLGVAGEQTAIGDALALAVQDTAKVPVGKKVIILLSDGFNNAGSISVSQATELAKAHQIAVYTIGIGGPRKNKTNLFGLITEDVTYNWDERALKRIASETGGRYFRAESTSDLTEVYRKIDQLETTDSEGRVVRPRKELFFYPLLAGLVFWTLAQYKRRKV